MLKLLMFVALVANILLIVSPTDTSKSKVTHNRAASSSSASSSTSSNSSNKSSSECNDGKSKKHPKDTTDDCSNNNTSKKCKGNETYVECPDFTCDPKTCDELGFPQPCPEHDENATCPGRPACLCIAGYLRNDEGVCVPRRECPSCGGDPNAVAGCGIHCGRYCPNYKQKPNDCVKICRVNSCDCKPDLLFDNNTGKCVAPEDCSKTCKGNETYVECPDFTCEPKTCDELGFPQPCPEHDENAICPGRPACLCIAGYLRNDEGVCVPRRECPSCGGDPNAVAGCGIHCGRYCPNYKQKPNDCVKICRVNSCDCKPDLLFDNNTGKCVAPEDCSKTCKGNETYVECPDFTCEPKTCDELGFPQSCPEHDENATCPGKPACLCIAGYLRNDEGVCVPRRECPSCGGDPNAVAGCGIHCGRYCPNYKQKPNDCVKICRVNSCDCKPDLLFDNNTGKCVAPEDCSKTCKGNETYVECPDFTCEPKTCDELGFPQSCPEHDENATCPGKPACLCIAGYLRNDEGVCVPRRECPSCGGDPNAVAGCGIHCGRYCPNYKQKPNDCVKICRVNSCDCKPDLLFDNNTGKCVAPEDCSKTCKGNETYVECPDFTCEPKTCDELGFPQSCPEHDENATCPGKPACLCIAGYLRNDEGVCVPRQECPSCGGDSNAVAGCGIHCGRYCPNYKEEPKDCAEICHLNGCDCKPDLLFDNNIGKCVEPEDCTPGCGKNEVYSSCTNGGCYGAKTCSEIGKPVICVRIDPRNCKQGCVCQTDHLRNENGICIPQDQCPKNTSITCNNPHEVYDACPPFCPPQKCSVDTRLIKCARYPNPGDPECEPSCRCIEGYLRDDEGVCIPKEQCPPFCGQNEVPSNCTNGGCFGARTCSEKGKPVRCVKLDPASCKKGCICEDGYLRNEDGLCVPQDQCPNDTNIVCINPHEVYDPCPPICPPLRCDVDPTLIDCKPNPVLGDPSCEPGCRCADGHLRNDDGVCIPKDQCPPHCGDNEIYSSCANGGCYGARNCSEIGRPVICVDLIEGACKGGCICQDKYLRNEEGVCIPEDQCPNSNETCTGVNEYYDTCPPACYPKTCDEIDLKFKCPPGECKPACRCVSDYYRNSQGVCVSEEECRSATCNNPNEVYDQCPATCPPQECGVDPRVILCRPNPKVGDPECAPGCRCADDYLRNDEGVCVHKDQCPIKCTEPNEEYDPCPINCPPQTCEAIGKVFPCPLIKTDCQGPGACKCKSGFFRNAINECISEKQCLKCSGPNEYYSCGGACDNVCATLSQQNQTNCPIINKKCNEMCYCKDGYARDVDNTCILIENCPKSKCGRNEEFSECKQKCVCRPRYFRSQDGICVPGK